MPSEYVVDSIFGGKYDSITRAVLRENLQMSNSDLFGFVGTLGGFGCRDFLDQTDLVSADDWIIQRLEMGEPYSTVYAASTLMHIAWEGKIWRHCRPFKRTDTVDQCCRPPLAR